ncbi:hypothetical protein Poly51_39780 [Rubripirellula tenax]|uniref:Uncharacterized protein n=1 Tax=Rubripirellula tenax TaxID=2528015 RepID=A0A5C6EPY8_9BACT|nr:hypothetical protein [Rubripirellula tenax]TWU50685.1 hypothetical protein Poly51_39780 [Rubripirellula tenax]
MPKFGCRCGHTISLVSVPSPHEANLIFDPEFDELCNRRTAAIDAFLAAVRDGKRDLWITEFYRRPPFDISDGSIIDDIITREDDFSLAIVVCPECGRLYRQRKHGENEYDCYVPESTDE